MTNTDELNIESVFSSFTKEQVVNCYLNHRINDSNIYYSGILFHANDSPNGVTLDFINAQNTLCKVRNKLDGVKVKYHWHRVENNSGNVFTIDEPFASFTLNSSNRAYFHALFARLTNLKKAPEFMQQYSLCAALSKQSSRLQTTNCKFGALYIMMSMLFEVTSEFNDDSLTTEHLTFIT